jgi:hypothetical protein
MKRRGIATVLGLALALLLLRPAPAAACGGCFAPLDAETLVNVHNMAVSLSPDRSILWDQIQYSGNPKDFVWVLPLATPDATIEIADQAFFDRLAEMTTPVVRAGIGGRPQGCFGCCSAAAPTLQDDSEGASEVTIYGENVVGPYETVILGSEDPDALQNWLVANGYRVPESVVPTIAHYVETGHVFAVLRLAPGEGIEAMQPVRISFPGFMSTFPLKMVKVGARGELELNLMIFAEQRYEALNYGNARVDEDEITFDLDNVRSDYNDIFEKTIFDNGGRVWITEYAQGVWYHENGADFSLIFEDQAMPYLTRLRTRMLLDYIDEDLKLGVAVDSSDVSNNLIAGKTIGAQTAANPPPDEAGCMSSASSQSQLGFGLLLLLAIGYVGRRARATRR